jgi:hypothetical protein
MRRGERLKGIERMLKRICHQSLSEYAGNLKPGVSMRHMKGKAWEVAVREKNNRKSS